MGSTPIVSIVVPVYNAGKYIKQTINMVRRQSFKDWELILVDDCSSDSSVRIINDCMIDERIKLFRQPKNMGAANARNRGIAEASGSYIAFLDADDIWNTEKLKKQLEFMKKNRCAFSYTAYEFGDENAIGTGKIVHVMPTISYKQALSRTIIFTSTVMFDMDKITKETISMPDVPSEDTATWWKILRNGYDAYGLDENLTVYRRPKQSLSSNKKEAVKRIWNLYRNVEGLSLPKALINFVMWGYRATKRRM